MSRLSLLSIACLILGGLLLLIPSGGDVVPVNPVGPVTPVEPIADESFKLGRHVLIVYETLDKPTYPSGQALILDSAEFKQFLNGTATDGWRILDKDANTEYMPEVFQKWMTRERDGLPWIVISNGQTGVEGELPATIDETKELIGKLLQ
jgi:hypothetical protein